MGDLFHILLYQPIFNLMMFIFGVFHSLTFAIIMTTIILRTLVLPLVLKSMRSMKATQALAPQVQEIRTKYKDDPVTANQQMMALYKENGVSPLGGCLPGLAQLPIFFTLFSVFQTMLPTGTDALALSHIATLNKDLYPFTHSLLGPNGLTQGNFPNLQFLWFQLNKPDPIFVLPVLTAILSYVQMRMAMMKPAQKNPGDPPDPTQQTMKYMPYIMPAFYLIIGIQYQTGLSLYILTTTIYGMIQQYYINGRNFGILFEGIPALSFLNRPSNDEVIPPPPVTRGRRTRVVVDAESNDGKPSSNGQSKTANNAKVPSLPSPRKSAQMLLESMESDEEELEEGSSIGNGNTIASQRTKSSSRSASPKRESVRLVSSHENGDTGAKSASVVKVASTAMPATSTNVVRTTKTPTRPVVATGTKPKGVGVSNSQRSGNVRTAGNPRKKK
jgi:YidC/Oxa1 family membrane protein insertase